jgi:mannan endo-1,4-beta-mannosidase
MRFLPIFTLLLVPLAALHAADSPGTAAGAPATAVGTSRFVRAEGAELTRAGTPFRAVGFNQPDLFTSLLLGGTEGRVKSFAAIDDAGRSQVRFLRFWASGFWPSEMKIYFEDKQAYWAVMDEVFRHAREQGVMLVPSIFWHSYLWSDLCDEPRGKMVDPQSKTYRAMRTYATELVSRYKDDPNVLMWEVGNEYFLEADLNAADRPKAENAGAKRLGTRPKRALDDSLSTDMLLSFYTGMTTHIHSVDPNHLVTSGDRGPRPTSVSLRKHFPKQVWQEDNLDDHLASLRNSQPKPLDVMSIHCYGNVDGRFLPDEESSLGLRNVGGLSLRGFELMTAYARTANAAGMPLFVGELGQHTPHFIEDPEARFACAAIDLLEKEGADVIAIWVWHFPPHPHHSLTGSACRPLMKRISEFNRQYAITPEFSRKK